MTVESTVLALVESTGVVADMAQFKPALSFKDNGVDSLDVMTVFLAVEEHFRVKFHDDEADSIRSVADIVRLLAAKGHV